MSLNRQIVIGSLVKSINNSKVMGGLDNDMVLLFNILQEYDEFTINQAQFADENLIIKDLITEIKYSYPKQICNFKAIAPSYINTGATITPPTPVLSNFTVGVSKQKIYPNSSTLYDAYTFNITDFLANYTDSDDNKFYQLIIDRTSLDDGSLKIATGNGINDYIIYGEDASTITILVNDISTITYFTDSTSLSLHDIQVKVVDNYSNILTMSAYATLTVDRVAIAGNLPPTLGDIAVKANNRVTTTLTLDMFTTSLTPPYNDPEGDLIDAIRFDEISTANVGVFKLNGVPVTEGQIVTREDINANLLTHEAADVSSIETDAFKFSARDEGSQIWVQ